MRIIDSSARQGSAAGWSAVWMWRLCSTFHRLFVSPELVSSLFPMRSWLVGWVNCCWVSPAHTSLSHDSGSRHYRLLVWAGHTTAVDIHYMYIIWRVYMTLGTSTPNHGYWDSLWNIVHKLQIDTDGLPRRIHFINSPWKLHIRSQMISVF
jgi:hypothetical protein